MGHHKHKKWQRKKKFNHHHMKNKCNGGLSVPANLLRMDTERHKAWHFLFHNLSFEEVAKLLIRVMKAKKVVKNDIIRDL